MAELGVFVTAAVRQRFAGLPINFFLSFCVRWIVPLVPAQRSRPTKIELLDAMDEAERILTEMVGRWMDGIPSQIRVELHDVASPLLRLLIRARRR